MCKQGPGWTGYVECGQGVMFAKAVEPAAVLIRVGGAVETESQLTSVYQVGASRRRVAI